MKKGQTIRGYHLLTDPRTANGGKSEYAFAEKDGEQLFLKRFLSPKYPVEGAPGSPAAKQRARARCDAFDQRQREVMSALKGKIGRGGNLVYTVDFFREGPQYFKVSEKIDTSTMKPDDLSRLSVQEKLLLLGTIAHSVNILHEVGIVHGDLKPANILIKHTNTGKYAAKVIGLDDSYFEGREIVVDDIVGDMVYFSPELLRRLKAGDGAASKIPLTRKSDVFALGIVFCEFWCGHKPDFQKSKYPYLCNAVIEGAHVKTTGRALPGPIEAMVVSMLSDSPDARPSLKEVLAKLKALKPDRVLEVIDEEHDKLGARPRERIAPARLMEERGPDGRALAIKPEYEPSRGPEYFISYAWGDDHTPEGREREAVVNCFCDVATVKGVAIIRDRTAMRPGDRISRFMERLGRGDRVFVFLSDKYLKSTYCMTELFEVWRHCREEAADFIARTRIYVLPDARIDTLKERTDYALYWRQKLVETDALVKAQGLGGLADADLLDYRRTETFASKTPDMLRLVMDVLKPRDFDAFVEYGLDDPPEGR
jgi:serine/threonine protein kinase